MKTERTAAIDFGTNTARLLIADRGADGRFEQVHIDRRIVRLGGGFSRDDGLSSEAIGRGMGCIREFAAQIARYAPARIRGVATSSVRDAPNGGAFVQQIQSETGIELKVIDGDIEGRLTLEGVLAGLDRMPEKLLVLDVGGGSTEYTAALNGRATFVCSLPIGVVRLTEGFKDIASMNSRIEGELSKLLEAAGDECHSMFSGATLVATAGTATTLAAIDLEMAEYDYRRVNNHLLGIDTIRRISDRLLPMAPYERLGVIGLEKGREDLIIPGIMIIVKTMELLGLDSMKVSDYGLLEGLIVTGSPLWD